MSTVGAMKEKVFGNRGQSCKAKMQVYNAMVVPMLMHGCEWWVLREKKIKAAGSGDECCEEGGRSDKDGSHWK